jgi:hypothetical protein
MRLLITNTQFSPEQILHALSRNNADISVMYAMIARVRFLIISDFSEIQLLATWSDKGTN